MEPGTIHVTVRCFSHVRNALGTDALALDLPVGATARTVEMTIRAMSPAELGGLPWRVAVNQEFTADDTPLRDGDEIALIPPVQGG